MEIVGYAVQLVLSLPFLIMALAMPVEMTKAAVKTVQEQLAEPKPVLLAGPSDGSAELDDAEPERSVNEVSVRAD